MAETLTSRLKIIKNDDLEFVDVDEINSGWDKADNHFIPACKMKNTVVQAIASGTPTNLQFNNVDFDSFAARSEGAMADLVNDRINIRRDGVYHVKCVIWTTTVSATGVMRMDIRKNGAAEYVNQMVPGASIITQEIETDLDLVAGDQLTINVNQTAGVSRNYTDNTLPDGFSFSAVWSGAIVEV